MSAESNQHRLDAAWEAAEEEYNANNKMMTTTPPLDDDGCCSSPSPLTAASLDYDDATSALPPPSQFNGNNTSTSTMLTYEDPFLLPSNETSPTSLESSSTTATAMQHYNSSPPQQQLQQLQQLQKNVPTLLNRYKTFLQNHEPLLSLVEMIMERFVFYGHLFKAHHHHNGNNGDDDDFDDGERGILRTEMYYATWNVIRWINDVVLVGVGSGMGLTVGTREEWLMLLLLQPQPQPPLSSSSSEKKEDASLSSSNNNNNNNNKLTLQEWITSRMHTIIPIIRATLTATTCIYPAVEAFSRRSILGYHNNNNRENDWEARRYRAALVSYKLERVRFMGRICLLVISWWAKLQRKRQQQQQQQQKQLMGQKGENNTTAFVPSLLQRGGELDPYEQLVPLKDAEEEANVVQYVGRRTGRRSVSSASSSTIGLSSHLPQQGISAALSNNIPFITKATNLIKWLSKLLTSSGGNKQLVYVYAVGEILHILRPLYWSRAECGEWSRRRLSSQQQNKQQQPIRNSWSIWKAWWVSLLMDLISDKLLRLTNSGGDAAMNNDVQGGRRRGSSSFMGRRGGKQSTAQHPHQSYSSSSSSPSAEEAKLAELEWRRSRHSLYLLRSPMYDVVTRPMASFIARVVSMIPSMGLGRWAAEYVLDMMSYWNNNHFMLES